MDKPITANQSQISNLSDPSRISLFIVSTPQMVEIVETGIRTEKNVIISGTCLYGQPLSLPSDNSIIAFEYSVEQEDHAKKYLAVLQEAQTPYIAICGNVQIGFSLLNKGASEFISLHEFPDTEHQKRSFCRLLISKAKLASANRDAPGRMLKHPIDVPIKKIIAIGSSTGGTEAIYSIIKKLPPNIPPVLIVQHMPPVFTKLYAERLDRSCDISVWEARDNDKLSHGLALIAPGDKHMSLVKKGNDYFVKCFAGEKTNGHCPSVDVLFNSVAETAAQITIGVILTGMGSDGAKGLVRMRSRGAFTIGQSEATCVIYGMPKVAYDLGGVDVQEDIENIASLILKNI